MSLASRIKYKLEIFLHKVIKQKNKTKFKSLKYRGLINSAILHLVFFITKIFQ